MASTAFPRINDMPSYALQQDQLRRAGWGGLPAIDYSVPTAARNQPMRRTPAQMYGTASSAGAGRGVINPASVQPQSASPYQSLMVPPVAANIPVNMAGFMTPTQQAQYPTQNFNVFNPDMVGGNAPMNFGSGMSGGASTGSGGFMDGLNALLAKGKEGWNNNKDWLIGNKEQAGLLPVGLGIFNAFNQYTAGKASINAMKEQNALARETFDLNKTGMLADYENQVSKRAQQDYLARNPGSQPTAILDAAKPVTEEYMKRFK